MNAVLHKWLWRNDGDCFNVNIWSCGECKTLYTDLESGQKMAEECCKDD